MIDIYEFIINLKRDNMSKTSNTKFMDYKLIANSVQNRIRKDKKALEWWKKNKNLVYKKELMPDYTIDEKLPLLENTNSPMEQIYNPNSNINLDKVTKGQLIYNSIMNTFWKLKDILGDTNRVIIEEYFINDKTMEDIGKDLGITKQAVFKRH